MYCLKTVVNMGKDVPVDIDWDEKATMMMTMTMVVVEVDDAMQRIVHLTKIQLLLASSLVRCCSFQGH